MLTDRKPNGMVDGGRQREVGRKREREPALNVASVAGGGGGGEK